MVKKVVTLRQGYGQTSQRRSLPAVALAQAGRLFVVLTYLPVRSARQAYSAEVATKAGSACGLAERTFLRRWLRIGFEHPPLALGGL